MAGRGCVITIRVTLDTNTTQELRLPVALHSPLAVLKVQLEVLTQIPFHQQVLILLDLNDTDRNSDRVLDDVDQVPLRNIGIGNLSTLTLHPLGFIHRINCDKKADTALCIHEHIHTLHTPISADRADHSYNGIIFDIKAKGPYEVAIKSIWVAGMLGRVRVFARDRPWERRAADEPAEVVGVGWCGQPRRSVPRAGYELVFDKKCPPSWDKPVELVLDKLITLLPNEERAIYVHSDLQDDLGIQYQSFGSHNHQMVEDDYIIVYAGVGHAGSEPFDVTNGWFTNVHGSRSARGPAGSISYTSKLKGWNPWDHLIFPSEIHDAVLTMLLVHGRMHPSNPMRNLPLHVLYHILEMMHWDWIADNAWRQSPQQV
jgi:hypothetical protein